VSDDPSTPEVPEIVQWATMVTKTSLTRIEPEFRLMDEWRSYKLLSLTASRATLLVTTNNGRRFTSECYFYTQNIPHLDFATCTITLEDMHQSEWAFRCHRLHNNNLVATGNANPMERPTYAADWWSVESQRSGIACELCGQNDRYVYDGYNGSVLVPVASRCDACKWVPIGMNARVR
jgi:hypothetical protein